MLAIVKTSYYIIILYKFLTFVNTTFQKILDQQKRIKMLEKKQNLQEELNQAILFLIYQNLTCQKIRAPCK